MNGIDKSFKVVVGIDFGSSGSGFAYSFNDENGIVIGTILGANVNNKIPTEIILDNNNKVATFGSGCSKYIKDKKNKILHYFKDIKMNLYSNKTIIEAKNTGKTLQLSLVIQKYLEELKSLAISEIKKNRKFIEKSDIKWVVTVPAIWQESEKGIMMEACINAGLIGDNDDKSLFFALEPEAASIYCLKNKEIDRNYFQKGKYYIVSDLGGGTGDIVTHLVGENQKLKEIECACGGNYGSNEINKKLFKDIIYKIFGYDNFYNFYENYKKSKVKEKEPEEILFGMWIELEREINDFKEGATIENINENESYPLTLSIFKDMLGEKNDINDLIERYNSICFDEDLKLKVSSKKRWVIDFPYKIIDHYIQEQALEICRAIKGIIKTSNKNIDTVILVGGYCANEILISTIKKSLIEIKHFLQPSRPCLAIMSGAVIFGINSDIINIRKARYTIGVSIKDFWDEEKHSKNGIKIWDENSKEWMCGSLFSKFIEINQDLSVGQKVTHIYYMTDPRYVTMPLYKTKKKNPMYVFEEGVEKIGECRLDTERNNSNDERELIETMKFGGTFLNFEAVHVKSGKRIKTTFKFD